jgi:hypothetical protein
VGAGVALALMLALLVCPPSRADSVLAGGLPQAPKVSAYGQALAWSEFDSGAGGWRLVLRVGGVTVMPAVPARSSPFDVDLGSDGQGRLVASYSRCSAPTQGLELPHGCRLYFYDLAAAVERPIAVANAAGRSQFDPSMAAGKVAFVRVDDRRPVGAGNRARIYVQRLAGGRPRELPGGSANNDSRTGPTALDLSPTALAFSWATHGPGLLPEAFEYGDAELRVDGLSGGQTLVERSTGGNLSSITELPPTLVAGAVDYGVAITGDTTEYTLRTFGLPDARAGVASALPGLASTATSSAGTVYARCPPPDFGPFAPVTRPCEVGLIDRVSYADPDREVAHANRPTTLSVGPVGNWVAWSAYDPATHSYRLMMRRPGGAILAVPVPPRSDPFDVELGLRAGGGTIAVYSRCRVEPRLDPRDRLPLPSTGRGCRLFRYDLGSSGERTIPGSGSRFLPSVWKGELAWAALGANNRVRLYLGSLDGHATPRRLPSGPAGTSAGLGPRALVVRDGRVAFVWEYGTRSGLRSQLRLDGRNGPSAVLDSATSRGGTTRELSPFFTGGVLAWARREAGGHSRLKIFGLATRRTSTYLMPDPVQAVGTNHLTVYRGGTSGGIFYARGDDRGGATIRLISQRSLPSKIG